MQRNTGWISSLIVTFLNLNSLKQGNCQKENLNKEKQGLATNLSVSRCVALQGVHMLSLHLEPLSGYRSGRPKL